MFPRVTAHALRLVHRRAMEEDGWMVLVFSESERDKTTRAADDADPTRVWNGCTRGLDRAGTSDVGNVRGARA